MIRLPTGISCCELEAPMRGVASVAYVLRDQDAVFETKDHMPVANDVYANILLVPACP